MGLDAKVSCLFVPLGGTMDVVMVVGGACSQGACVGVVIPALDRVAVMLLRH